MGQPTKSRPVGNRRKKVSDLPAVYSKELSENVKWDVVAVCRHELRKRKKDGRYDGNPDDFHPARYLANVIEDETVAHLIRVVAARELMPYFGIDKATLARIEANMDGPSHISISIAGYAAGPLAPAAIGTPRKINIPALDVVANDREAPLHKDSVATPESDRSTYQEYDVNDGTAVAREDEPTGSKPATDEPVVITDGVGNSYRITRPV
jgi:hypothetical protein